MNAIIEFKSKFKILIMSMQIWDIWFFSVDFVVGEVIIYNS